MNIVVNSTRVMRITDFISNIYTSDSKPILFWDTCALLDVLRFVFKYPDDASTIYGQTKYIIDKITNGDIYSVASEIEIDELNDNHTKAVNYLVDSLKETSNYHSNAIKAANALSGNTYVSESLVNKHIDSLLNQHLLNVLQETYFLEMEEVHSHSALQRVRSNIPPAGKKQEFKDCAIWETALGLFRGISQLGAGMNNVFYTSNTDDFCSAKNNKFLYNLVSEATTYNFNCCMFITEVRQYF